MAFHELNLLRAEVPAIQEKLESGDYQSACQAATNLRTRETLLHQKTYDLIENRMVASVH